VGGLTLTYQYFSPLSAAPIRRHRPKRAGAPAFRSPARCYFTVMRGQLRFGLAGVSGHSVLMASPNPPPFVRCPSCKALYQVVKGEAGPETVDLDEVACSICSGPLVAREGQFILKYFLLRKAIPVKGPTALRAKPR
jgi:hypothetical protein